jgi:hypothetical protein
MKGLKIDLLLAGILLVLIFSASTPYAAESLAAGPGPVAVMPETSFEFPSAVEGDAITHDFIIQNRGNADLSVIKIKTT